MNVTLQAVDYKHLGWLRHQRNQKAVMDFCRQAIPLNEASQEEWFKKVSRDRSMIPFIVQDDQTWVGYIAFSNIDWIARRAEISCFTSPESAGKGYAEAAIELMLEYGFRTLGFQKIYTDTFATNQIEVEFMKKIGFKETGILPRHYFKRGQLIDSICLCAFSEEFIPSEEVLKQEKIQCSKPL